MAFLHLFLKGVSAVKKIEHVTDLFRGKYAGIGNGLCFPGQFLCQWNVL